jgi:chromosome segregation ATPase
LENENFYLKKKIKELEESNLKSHDEFLNNDIHRIKDFQEKEQKLMREVETIEQKFNKLQWKHEKVLQENNFLQKEVKEMTEDKKKLEILFEEKILELQQITSKFRYLESQLEYEKMRRKEKTFEHKQKISRLVQDFQDFSQEKEKLIEKLEENSKKQKNFCKSPLKSSRTPRKNSVNQLLEITNTISSLERSQAEYKQKYINLQKSKIGSFKEIHNLYDILQNNEKRLKQAKKLQENIFKST